MIEEKRKNKQIRIKKKDKEKNSVKKNYAVCVCGIIILMVLAFCGPKIVFAIQDTYQLGRIWQGARNSLDMEAIYSSYGSLRERMEAFSERLAEGYDFYVAGTDYRVTAELLDLLDVIVSQEGYALLIDYGVAPYLLEVKNRGYTIDEWKKYVIYSDISEEENNAVVVSGWYIAFTTRDEVTIKLLVDTETYELYYMQITAQDYAVEFPYLEKLYDLGLFLGTDWLSYWFDYYEAGETPVQTFEGYMANIMANELNYGGIVADDTAQSAETQKTTMELPYWDYSLKWQFGVQLLSAENIPFTLSIGLTDIAVLIPELQED